MVDVVHGFDFVPAEYFKVTLFSDLHTAKQKYFSSSNALRFIPTKPTSLQSDTV